MHGQRRVTIRRGATPFSSTPLWREKCAGCDRVSRWDISGYLGSWRFNDAGETPNVLACDPGARRVYVAAESGFVSVLITTADISLREVRPTSPTVRVALDPGTHHSYFPIPKGFNGSPVPWEFEPTT